VLSPVVLGWIVDDGIEGEDRVVVWIGAGLILVLGAAEALSDALRHRVENAASARAGAALRSDLLRHALGLGEDGRDRFPASELTARATSDVDAVADLLDAWATPPRMR
jgi:ATP-binding cassette, subfamily B, bacterial